ncbi:MAG: hypothetical protein JF595_11930 [Sphingomonadales bacterium]|nr:hypothetical protein [Sphingomonadales bacterium]
MNFWTAMVAIVAIAGFTSMRMARYRAGLGDRPPRRAITGSAAAAIASPREVELQKEVDDLRQRIAVLERIATEDRHSKSIAAEIDALRDR